MVSNIKIKRKNYWQGFLSPKIWMLSLICILTVLQVQAQPPANDEPCAATPLTVGATCTFATFTNVDATSSPGVPAPGCAGYSGGDVWFSFVVPAGGSVIIDAIQGQITDGGMAIYSGTCGSLTLIECDDDDSDNGAMPSITRTGLTPGNTIFVRFWEYGNNLFGTFGICVTIPPPPPANDECSGAIPLTVNADLSCTVVTQATTVSATPSTGVTAPTCSATGANDDVWFTFVATSTLHTVGIQNVSGNGDRIIQVYSGTCGSLVPIICSDPESFVLNGLTIGTTYTLRVYTISTSSAITSTFNICVGTPPPPPANDECTGAIPLTVNADQNCTVVTQATTEFATPSTGVTAPTCTPAGANDDVWFSFVATGPVHLISLTNISGSTDRVTQVYSGTCGSLVALLCSDPESLTVGGLTTGQTYLVRVYTYSSVGTTNSTFNICVGTPPPPPANDECAGAIPLTVNPDLNCGSVTLGTTEFATSSTGVTAPTCAATGANDDVWFSFVAVGTAHVIALTNVSGSGDRVMQVYSGTCGSLVPIVCSDPETVGAYGLTPGETYLVRVYTYSSSSTTNSTFNICVGTPPPPPANDECSGAVSLTVNPDLLCGVVTQGTTVSATPSTGVTAPTCAATGANDDVWYSFVATNTAHVISYENISGSSDMNTQVYSGSCGSLVAIMCSDPDPLVVGGLTVGATYYVRVYTWSSSTSTNSTFNICIGTPPPPPSNDDCAGAISLTVNPDMLCGVVTQGTTVSATASSGVPAPTCFATGINDDVWYSFVATTTSHTISYQNLEGSSDLITQVYSGTCGSLVPIVCSDPEFFVVNGLTAGETYFVRVYTWSSSSTTTSTFNICVSTMPLTPPTNDDCSGAIDVPVNPDLNCGQVVQGSTASATSSTASGAPSPSCNATGANDDIWYSFVATNMSHNISFTNISGISTDLAFEVYNGDCSSLTSMICSDPESQIITGLTVGATYYVRVWTWSSTAGTFSNFTICVGTPPPPPANDEPCNAALIMPTYNCNFQTYYTYSATSSLNVPAPGCASYSGGDVWFKTVVPCGGAIIINTINMDFTDGGMALYTGNCSGGLTLLECDDDDSENGLMPMISRTGLTPGDTVYIRFWEYGNNAEGNFGICVTIPPPPPPGSDCASANPFCTSQTYTVPNTVGVPSMGGNGIYDCLFTTPNPAWYYMQVQTAGDIIIGISQTSTTTGAGIDVDYAVWGPFATLASACSGLTEANNISCSYSPFPTETATILNAQVGQFYMILLTNYSNQPGTITFQQTSGAGSSNCANICTITASNSGPICPGGNVDLSTPGPSGTGATYQWTGPDCWSSTDQNPTGVTPPAEPGTYNYSVVSTLPDGTSCHATTTVVVNAAPVLAADANIFTCTGSPVDLYAVYDTIGLSSVWSLNGGTVSNPAAVSVSGQYQLIASNGTNCSDTAYVTVTVDSVAVSLDVVNPDCSNEGTITVNTTSGISPFTYAISTDPGVFQSSNEFIVTPGAYQITTRDSLGCTIVTDVTVDFNDNLQVSTVSDLVICDGQSVTLTTTGNAETYTWSPAAGLSNPNIASPVASPTSNTVYTLTATLGSCSTTVQSTVNIGNGVTANAGPDISIVNGEQAILQGTATGTVSSISWTPTTGLTSPGSLVTYVNPQGPGSTVYTLTVTSPQGCVDSDDMTLTVIPVCINVKNAFSPNGDGMNDQWVIYDDYSCLRNIEVNVFNRYGNLVYQNRDYRNNWDGTYKGKPIPDGTYYAVINFTMINGRKFTSKTDLTVIR